MSEERIKAVIAAERHRIALRDQFAMAALQGLCSKTEHTLSVDRIANRIPLTAAEAYEYADAMMAEREKNMYTSRGPEGVVVNHGWVNWTGGDIPVDGCVLVDVCYKNNDRDTAVRADELSWRHDGITAYRISRSRV